MRWTLGPAFGKITRQAPPAPPAKLDIEVGTNGITGDVAMLSIPAYGLATHNRLMEVRCYVVLEGEPLPVDGPAYVASPHPFGSVDVSAVQDGGEHGVTLPATVADGVYFVQAVLGFEA